jgi:hypothetical protein
LSIRGRQSPPLDATLYAPRSACYGSRMMRQRLGAVTFCAVATALLLGCLPPAETAPNAGPAAEDRREAEAYALYSAYLDHLAAGNYLMKNRQIAFILASAPDPCRRCDDLDRLFSAGALRPETRADFRNRAAGSMALRSAFRLRRASYALAGPDPARRPEDGVTVVRVSLSPAGFNDDLTQGLFRVGFALEDCKGSGDVLMQKSGDLWLLAQEVVEVTCE